MSFTTKEEELKLRNKNKPKKEISIKQGKFCDDYTCTQTRQKMNEINFNKEVEKLVGGLWND